jgi:hypothetical protein
MANGRRRPARATGARRTAPPARNGGGRRPGPARNGGGGLASLHPAVIVGLVVVPLLLIVVIVLAAGGGGGEKSPTLPVSSAPVSNASTVPAHPATPQPVRDTYIPLTRGQLDVVEREWAPLRQRAQEFERLWKAGRDAWQKDDSDLMQEKFRAANEVWRELRDRANEILGRFTEEQQERDLDRYDTELASWGKQYATYQKMVVPER